MYHIFMSSNLNDINKNTIDRGGRLSVGAKLGYASAGIGDSVCYSVVGTFLLFFLTTVAGLQPAVAGTIVIISAVFDGLWNPVMGYISDHHVSGRGRRRPYMLGFVLPLMISITLLFTATEMTYTVKVFYYGFMTIAFWFSFTGFFVPFYALGAEYSDDYDERTSIRSFATFFNMLGTLFSMAAPMALVDWLSNHGMTTEHAWTLVVAILAVISGVSIIITVIASKDVDVNSYGQNPEIAAESADSADADQSPGIMGIFKDFIEVFKLKPTKYIVAICMCSLIAYAIFLSDFMYFLTYNLGFDGNESSMALLVRCIYGILLIPAAAALSHKTDNRTAMIIVFLLSSVLVVVERFVDVNGLISIGWFILIMTIATTVYWQLVPAIVYEVCVYDEYMTGKRREGVIVSLQGMVEGISAGIGAQLLGIILQIVGFDGEAATQSPFVQEWIFNCTTWVPVVFLLVAAFALYKYPISRESFNEMNSALKERKGE